MKKRIKVTTRLAFGFIFLALITASCNNSGKSKKADDTTSESPESDTSTKSENVDTTKAGVGDMETLYTVRMRVQNFQDILQSLSGENGIKMIYFEFDEKYTSGWSLRAYGADQTGGRQTGDFPLDTVNNGHSIQFIPNRHHYKQAITRGHLKDFLNLRTLLRVDKPIKYGQLREVWLTPCIINDTISYKITYPNSANATCGEQLKANQAGLIVTNPSPPDNPCYENCDEEQFMLLFKNARPKQE